MLPPSWWEMLILEWRRLLSIDKLKQEAQFYSQFLMVATTVSNYKRAGSTLSFRAYSDVSLECQALEGGPYTKPQTCEQQLDAVRPTAGVTDPEQHLAGSGSRIRPTLRKFTKIGNDKGKLIFIIVLFTKQILLII